MKKYELTDITIEQSGVTLYRIRAVRAIKALGIKKGDLGGYVEKGENLSQSGAAWISGNASVSGDARVCCDAWISGAAWISGNASVCGDARVYGNARVCGDASVSGNARVYGNASVSGDADIIWCSKIGLRLDTTTAFIEKDGGVKIVCGCFCGMLNEFERKVEETHGDNIYGKEYKAFIELIKIHFGKV
nr:MAG TPA: Putative transferase, nesg, ydcK, Structural Genomics.38A [Caudoviricetes sp.]